MVFSESEGDKGVAYVCIFLAAQAFYQFTLGLYALIQWDFRDEDDDEKVIGSGSDTASARHTHDTISSNASTPSEKHRHSDSNFQAPTPVVRTPEDADSYDDALSISSSLPSNQMVEVPLPTNLGEETYRTGSQRLSHRIGTASLLPIRSRDLRSMKSQDIGDVINEYSEYDRLNDNSNLSGVQRMITLGSDTIGPAIMVGGESLSKPLTNASKIEVVTSKVRQRLYSILKNTLAPVSISLILALAVAMAPPLKALFVSSAFSIPDAPDGLPPLSFLLDTASYMGQASVPLGLLLLGATISRLDLKGMPKGFYKTVLGIVLFRLVLLPMVGVGLVAGLNRAGWYDGNKLIRFISVLEFGLPNATALVYFTAFYTDPNSEDHIQMDCLAAALISQYAVLFITLPFLVSFTIKVTLGY
ncbi:auxin efflux carrier [Yamadazyma tenuis ATCC 10573]|uniref:Auxin efflux carrier n=2 Tax=Candida tenuis TaxID=2315449 RepID=G3AWS4_CANTC|nr:auxin efflux carrier [Yamadazyma tenuis ATCC 10573]EGV66602.1 auxin efflux carrier [Yamadazyma tenuis ATCC 10573]